MPCHWLHLALDRADRFVLFRMMPRNLLLSVAAARDRLIPITKKKPVSFEAGFLFPRPLTRRAAGFGETQVAFGGDGVSPSTASAKGLIRSSAGLDRSLRRAGFVLAHGTSALSIPIETHCPSRWTGGGHPDGDHAGIGMPVRMGYPTREYLSLECF